MFIGWYIICIINGIITCSTAEWCTTFSPKIYLHCHHVAYLVASVGVCPIFRNPQIYELIDQERYGLSQWWVAGRIGRSFQSDSWDVKQQHCYMDHIASGNDCYIEHGHRTYLFFPSQDRDFSWRKRLPEGIYVIDRSNGVNIVSRRWYLLKHVNSIGWIVYRNCSEFSQ